MSFLYLTVLFPLIGFVLLAAGRNKLPENVAAIIGVGAVGLSALVALIAGLDFVNNGKVTYVQHLWTWFNVGNLSPGISLHLDGLSLLMMGMVTGVGFLIHIFASWYMRGEEDFARFFSYFNLFVASMLLLVLGDNLALLFLGWEGVGLCSYLLIGYYYQNPANGFAAIKAFTVTRVGDVFLLIALFLIYQQFGTLNIAEVVAAAPTVMTQSSSLTIWTALMLFLGAAGKSAQIPLQTWLADAMAGPTPVSALIHAATMVTAGVYLCCRMYTVFEMAPEVMMFISITGAVTLLVAGFAALVQTDIKRILAYSTMSQLGYMFMAVGAEAYQAGLFHMLTHAFFKALLFLSSGAVILAYHHEQNIFKMGGLFYKNKFLFACFAIGGGALAAIPFITVGFFSKDAILGAVWVQGESIAVYNSLYWVGVAGAFLTSIYTFRLIWVVFFGKENTPYHAIKGITFWGPLAILAVLSTFVGAALKAPVESILNAAKIPAFVIPEALEHGMHSAEYTAVGIALVGLVIGVVLFAFAYGAVKGFAKTSLGAGLANICRNALGFDALYDIVFVKPYLLIAKILGRDPIDRLWLVLPALVKGGHSFTSSRQTGSLRDYASSMALGIFVLLMVLIVTQIVGK
ncbi:MAG: NADH-quinone oxidoreductase subunit L [Pseudomonadales bacterium RIFCSPHIGHO2_12_FULL_40_16]|jgi:NADH-quinone oxidoreductase subunit L|uniref:NADH-quinone oxidoreductase subunit L n=2 Tax=Acinetobacter TaxID=469 RepID=A0A3S9AMY1_ACIJO|nr:NADH-quinone oxidoreductase subunit L [Acinetobacter johnsonii]NWK49199.1 NADH-quinone oxidoreductase subunit L [Acinetobacter sp. SwsAc7]OHC22796.1 MAG: NADH-quinone oxidoreductase subunit L [Pseudomonadales bacterium RIFCSPHIGHO2_12_FULL_40_16]AZN64931.1 NADH-quinone oxidoreductase subunit L [Acinetobacter johnsonii]MCF7642681.1 NADH-quinone oxidoreductase subunit L [Acinetobacter johnsonii]MDH1704466.1 NADH-quinone oxidoreductase subunit L [Acinetobacter johnsonii]